MPEFFPLLKEMTGITKMTRRISVYQETIALPMKIGFLFLTAESDPYFLP